MHTTLAELTEHKIISIIRGVSSVDILPVANALYRGGMKDASDRGWRKSKKIIASQISKIRRSEKAYGYILFSYESLYKKAFACCEKRWATRCTSGPAPFLHRYR